MRAASLALLATLWFTTSPAFSRNGETGILIVVKRFETKVDDLDRRTFVICNDDWQAIHQSLNQGLVTTIVLQSFGVYEVMMNDKGGLRIRPVNHWPAEEGGQLPIEGESEASYSLLPQNCTSAEMIPASFADC